MKSATPEPHWPISSLHVSSLYLSLAGCMAAILLQIFAKQPLISIGSLLVTLLAGLIALRTTRHSASSDPSIQAVLGYLHEDFSPAWWAHYRELVQKRKSESLTAEDHRELIALTDALEEMSIWKATALSRLAQRTGISIEQLTRQSGIKPHAVA